MKYIICFILFFTLPTAMQAQSLEVLMQEAIDNNPSLQRLDYQYKVAIEKVNEVNTLPNTQFNFGFMAVMPEMDMPMERFSISAMQMLPWFGTLDAKKNYAHAMAETQWIDITIAQRKLALSVAQIYYQMYEIAAQQKVLQQHIQLLETFEKLALSSVSVGKTSTVEVLRLQIRENEIEEELALLSLKNEGLTAALNSLLNRDYNVPIEVDPHLTFPESEPIFTYEQLANNPELQKYDQVSKTIEQSELMNLKESSPVLGVGIKYVNQTDSPMISSSFKDMIMPMVSLSIPIFNTKFKSISAQNKLRGLEVEAQRDERLNQLTTQLSKAISEMRQARIKYNTQKDNLIIAKNAEKILLKNYETGTIDYDEVLKIQELQLKFEKAQIKAIKTYYEQKSMIDYLTQL